MALLTLRDVELGYGGPNLLDGIDFVLEPGERVALVGRNGSGKSTFLKLLSGEVKPDNGTIEFAGGLKVGRLEQEEPENQDQTVFDFVAGGAGPIAKLLSDYHRVCADVDLDAEKMAELQHSIDDANGWDLERRVNQALSDMDLTGEPILQSLSGGQRRRAALARALMLEPDILILDEPTNHLDIENIDKLEKLLLQSKFALLFVSHDRRFTAALVTRVIELDRGKLFNWPGDWNNFLRRREEQLNAESQETSRLTKKLDEEIAWSRQGVKARGTRNQGRLRALNKLRGEMAERRQQQGSAKASAELGQRSGKMVIEAEHIDFAYEGTSLINDFSTYVERGDKIALIGPNGVGKTTLLRILLGELQPNSGKVAHGTKLQIGYFDQTRMQLDSSMRVQDSIADGNDFIDVGGKRRHVLSYLEDYLFTPARARSPISSLSGGEHNRLLLARLLARPSNLLVLDEPTNDLDVETLEVLESVLVEYTGTILLISHDREFVDNVVGSVWVFEGNGIISEHVGGYSDWKRNHATKPAPSRPSPEKTPAKEQKPAAKNKLSYKDQRELGKLPEKIEKLETTVEDLQTQLADPAVYQDVNSNKVTELQATLAEKEASLSVCYKRWEELEALL